MDAGLDDQDESVRIAVRALGDMRNSVSRPSFDSSSSPTSPSDTPAFVARMSHIPFVNSALRVYEQGKASSRMVKYGAEMVESSVITISRPVINRLPVDVNQLDEFACRQLDRLDRYRHLSTSDSQGPGMIVDSEHEKGNPKSKTDGSEDDDTSIQHDAELLANNNNPSLAPPPDSRSSTPTQNGDDQQQRSSKTPTTGVSASCAEDEIRVVAQRSRWQAVLLEAGGLSAALSEESMRRLKYCLHWLQYATSYIDAHILFLRDFTANLQPLPSDSTTTARRPPISEEHMRRLMDVRRDIVHTIRQAVDIVSKYAGGALPEPARTRVKGFILTLPQRWASKASGTGGTAVAAAAAAAGGERDSTVTAAASGSGATRRLGGQRRAAYRERGPCAGGGEGDLRSGASSRAPSPSSPRISRTAAVGNNKRGCSGDVNGDADVGGEGGGGGGKVRAGTALVAAQRILVLATESLDMMRNVTGVMKDSLDRAEAWVGRLRTVGIQRDTSVDEETVSEFEFSQRRLQARDTADDQENGHNNNNIPSSPLFFSASSTVWGSNGSVPSTPGGEGFTPAYVSAASGSGSPGMVIPIGAMSLSSRYETPRSVLSLGGEEEEEEEEGEGVVKGEEEEEEEEEGKGSMDVDV